MERVGIGALPDQSINVEHEGDTLAFSDSAYVCDALTGTKTIHYARAVASGCRAIGRRTRAR
ncbi:hypothetical protein BLAT2472_50041 [Burkholderia latens]